MVKRPHEEEDDDVVVVEGDDETVEDSGDEEAEDEEAEDEEDEDEEDEDEEEGEGEEATASSGDDGEGEDGDEHDGEEEDSTPSPLRSPTEWARIIAGDPPVGDYFSAKGAEKTEDIATAARGIRPSFVQATPTDPWMPSEGLTALVEGFFCFLSSKQPIKPKILRGLATSLFGRPDVFALIARAAEEQMKKWPSSPSAPCWRNAVVFLKAIPLPCDKGCKPFFAGECRRLEKGNRGKRSARALQDYVLALTRHELSTPLHLSLMDWLSTATGGPGAEAPLGQCPQPQLLAQYFFTQFAKGSTHAIYALGGLLNLVMKHNFEYPQLFESIYALITPASFYLNQNSKLVDIVDLVLSSTHLAVYIVASYVKKLARCLLYAPFDVQESVQGLIRNAITRHSTIIFLVQRQAPDSVDADPFDEEATDLKATGAMQSSLWELRTLQRHWFLPVAKRARFIDGGLQQTESFVRYRDADAYWAETISKVYGEGLLKERYDQGDAPMEEAEQRVAKKIPIADNAPMAGTQLFAPKSFLADWSTVWKY